ncbi:MAG: hypothetical protein M3336_03485, partial [Chloroflexota bacterium]|nr:hypothetical protein [Chloroflexota bacterium]
TQSEPEHGGVLKASSPGAAQIQVGMDVLGVDGELVGRVKEVRAGDFLVDRPVARDLYVPYEYVLSVPDRGEKPARPTQVVLTIPAAHLDRHGFEQPRH